MTSKPISQRLKEVGFEVISPDNGFYAQAGEDLEVGIMSRDVKKDEWYDCTYLGDFYFEDEWYNQLNSYDAETLFMWLRPYGNKKDIGWFINHNEIVVSLHEGRDGIAEFKTSLADMLGEAIIWILENK